MIQVSIATIGLIMFMTWKASNAVHDIKREFNSGISNVATKVEVVRENHASIKEDVGEIKDDLTDLKINVRLVQSKTEDNADAIRKASEQAQYRHSDDPGNR